MPPFAMEQNKMKKKAIRIKIISMGNAETGKSCIIKRYCEKRFVQKYLATIGIDFGVTKIMINDREVKVNIFDMAGHPIFYEVRNEFYRDSQGAILVYDVSDRQSFDALEDWVNEMKNEMGSPKEFENVVVVVCANKTDKKRNVEEAEARIWADSHGFDYYETSAQTGDGVPDMFKALFDGVVTTFENGGRRKPSTTQLGYTREQVDAIQRLKNAKDDFQRLGLHAGANKDDINRAYRKLAVLLHPDKSVAPGSEDAFKLLVQARTSLLKSVR